MSSETFQYIPWYTNMLEKVGFSLIKEHIILDLGCGAGECVHQFKDNGYNIFGCDIEFPKLPSPLLNSYFETGVIRKINFYQDPRDRMEEYLKFGKLVETNETSYHLPFEDNTFDAIFSGQVFEHVMDYPAVLAELKRIVKPEGVNIHIFPGRWMVREPHIYVPFASVLRSYWWLYLWALLGIRNEFQQGKPAVETAKRNYWYLHRRTNYLSRKQIQEHVRRYFDECRFTEEAYFYVSSQVGKWFKRFPFLLNIYRKWFSDTQMRVLVFERKIGV
jgi:SAM-dependent methyltransferase